MATGFAVACTKDAAPIAIATLAFPRAQDSVLIGRTVQLVATARDIAGTLLSGRRITYSIDKPTVAEVDTTGTVTGKAAAQAVLTAAADGKTATMGVQVLIPASQVIVAPVSADVPLGTSRQLIASPLTSANLALSGRTVAWQSSNPTIALVSSNGLVTAVAVGTVTITATTDLERVVTGTGATGSATINVTDPVQTVRMSPSIPQILRVGNTLQVSAQPLNAAQQPVTRPIVWNSSNPAIATVSQTGLVTAVAFGQATIIAESENRQGTLGINVLPVQVARVDLTPIDTVRVVVGGLTQFSFVARDSAGNVLTLNNRTVVWSSDNFPIVNVNQSGIAQGIQAGVGKISVTVDQVKSNETPVKVSLVPVATVTVTPNGVTLNVGNVLQMFATLRDANGNVLGNRPIVWSVSDTALATITQAGVLTALAPGSVTVTAIAEGISGTAVITIP